MLVYANKVRLKWSSQWAIKAILQLANVAAMCMACHDYCKAGNLVSIKFAEKKKKVWQNYSFANL